MQDQIKSDLQSAQLARDEVKVSTLRLLISELNNAKIAKGEGLEEKDVIQVLQREIKKRKEAAEGFRSGNSEERAQKEETEAKILEGYLPSQLSDKQLQTIVDEAISKIAASNMADMGKVIGLVMAKVQGQADGGRVSSMVKQKLS